MRDAIVNLPDKQRVKLLDQLRALVPFSPRTSRVWTAHCAPLTQQTVNLDLAFSMAPPPSVIDEVRGQVLARSNQPNAEGREGAVCALRRKDPVLFLVGGAFSFLSLTSIAASFCHCSNGIVSSSCLPRKCDIAQTRKRSDVTLGQHRRCLLLCQQAVY